MNTYQLPGMALSVDGEPSRILFAMESIFQLCPRTEKQADIYLKGYGYFNNEFHGLLPDWVEKRTSASNVGTEPVMFFGPEGQPATIAVYEGLLSCAWMAEKGHQIQLIAGMKNEGSTTGIIPSVLAPILRESFLARGRLLLHSAAVICPNGIGLLIIAVSGGGKTTTALSLVRKGARLLGDDLVVIQSSTNGITAHGIPKTLNLTNKTICFFKELQKIPCSAFSSIGFFKKSIPLHQVYGTASVANQCNLNVVYFVTVAKEGPSVRHLPVEEALEKLILAHAFCHNQKINGISVLELCKWLSRIRAYELKTGPDPNNLGNWLISNCSIHADI